jgi:hypothetical protein
MHVEHDLLRDENRLSISENRLLRRIFGPKKEGVSGSWRKLHNEVNSLPHIRRIK